MKSLRHTFFGLLAAAGLCLLAVGSLSCADGRPAPAADVEARPTADTLALVKGLRLFEDGEYDLAREQLRVSACSESTYIRAESFLYLNALEMELGNYDVAHAHLDRYHAETVRLLRGAADASKRTAEQTARLRKRQDILIAVMIVVAVLMVGAVVFFVRQRPHTSTETGIESGNGSSEGGSAPNDWATEFRPWLVDAEIFKQTAIWAEIVVLTGQQPGREARVLPSVRQEVLDRELAARFSNFIARLRGDYSSLTAGDIKLCCLSLLPLSAFGRALCFGSTETNIIKQRKHTIKKKLSSDARGRALFEFIFEGRG